MENNQLNIGKNIQKIRKQKKITQESLAELSNLSINYISKIERLSDQNVSVKSLFQISNALEVSPLELLSFETSDFEKGFYTESLISLLSELDTKTANSLSKQILQLIEVSKELK